MPTFSRRLTLIALLACLGAARPALAGPPWISIELPANPYDASRGAFLLVHAYHHGTPVIDLISGTAEGIVNGERRTITLEFSSSGRDDVRALKKMWPDEGVWTLVITATQAPGETATAVVEIGPDGQVSSVRVPSRWVGDHVEPVSVARADIDSSLRARAGALARKS
jgi:hypothetical protein